MPLQKQPVAINFMKGLDLKNDPFQVPIGSFLALSNSVFTTGGRLTKRNGFQNITSLPNNQQTIITTLNNNLVATGSQLYAFSEETNQWIDQGIVQPINLSTLPLVRVSTSQTSPDLAISSSGLSCLVYIDSNGNAYYHIIDSKNGSQIVSRTALPATSVSARAFVLGVYFIVTFIATVAGSPTLQYIAIPLANPQNPGPATTISTDVTSLSAGYDAYSINNSLYLAWSGGTAINVAYLTNFLALSPIESIAGSTATLVSVTADTPSNRVWVTWWDSGSTNGYTAAFNFVLIQILVKTQIITATPIAEITSIVNNGILDVFYENINDYGYDAAIRTDYISTVTVTQSGTVTGPTIILRSVGLASKAFIGPNDTIYMLVAYGDTNLSPSSDDSNEPTYFLMDSLGNVYMRLAYSNGGGYARSQVLPSVNYILAEYCVPYLNNDFLATVNKGTNLPAGSQINAIYTQTGVNLAKFTINNSGQYSSEVASALHLTGGQLWEYDGVKPVEHGFHVWPENVEVTTSGSGGSIGAGTYYYQFTYEWTDNAGNLHRSAPSIPVSITTTGSTSTNTIYVPTLRITYKQPFLPPTNPAVKNPVRIVGYRWSAAQEVYYQFTSLTMPTLNDTTIDYVTFTDTLADSSILGNVILYTTGGVVEDIAAPASIDSALFDNRLWLIDAEDRNLLWYSKQVIENVPVEMSDLLTLYVAPTIGSQGSTGPMTAISAMDDKLIIFKANAIYYINGAGPDNTGANSTYSQPIFITSSVGCSDPSSVVITVNGIMFQSDKGIWLLGRDLSTNYIGAPVEQYNDQAVLSAQVIPGTTQVRFILQNDITLMYDYFYQQWATHTNIAAIYATLYQNLHTYLNSYGEVFQENPNSYVDGSEPVLMGLTTSWINIAGLQGFERFYFANLLGTYFTPFKLNVSFAYNYNPSPSQNILITPDNYTPPWGGEAQWGSGTGWGSDISDAADNNSNVFSERLFPEIQKCQSFQVSIQEVYDSSLGVAPGQGLSLSGLALVVGMKKGYRTQSAARSWG
jgi:hypothetical protein